MISQDLTEVQSLAKFVRFTAFFNVNCRDPFKYHLLNPIKLLIIAIDL